MEKRQFTRSTAWPGTEAVLTYTDRTSNRSRQLSTLRGAVENLGSNGMFLKTKEFVPIDQQVDITIQFQPKNPDGPSVKANGKIIRATDEGIGIQFTAIDLARLGECIMAMLNNQDN